MGRTRGRCRPCRSGSPCRGLEGTSSTRAGRQLTTSYCKQRRDRGRRGRTVDVWHAARADERVDEGAGDLVVVACAVVDGDSRGRADGRAAGGGRRAKEEDACDEDGDDNGDGPLDACWQAQARHGGEGRGWSSCSSTCSTAAARLRNQDASDAPFALPSFCLYPQPPSPLPFFSLLRVVMAVRPLHTRAIFFLLSACLGLVLWTFLASPVPSSVAPVLPHEGGRTPISYDLSSPPTAEPCHDIIYDGQRRLVEAYRCSPRSLASSDSPSLTGGASFPPFFLPQRAPQGHHPRLHPRSPGLREQGCVSIRAGMEP